MLPLILLPAAEALITALVTGCVWRSPCSVAAGHNNRGQTTLKGPGSIYSPTETSLVDLR